jgi:hypothetical protein
MISKNNSAFVSFNAPFSLTVKKVNSPLIIYIFMKYIQMCFIRDRPFIYVRFEAFKVTLCKEVFAGDQS